MRDNAWLINKMDEVWEKYFKDVPRLNKIRIYFGRRAKRRLASIRQHSRYDRNSDTEIRVTGYYKLEAVPDFVIESTIAHELVHYSHGFASPLPQYSKYPHKGDVVDNDIIKRGMKSLLKSQEQWLAQNWQDITRESDKKKSKPRLRTRKKQVSILKQIRLFLTNN